MHIIENGLEVAEQQPEQVTFEVIIINKVAIRDSAIVCKLAITEYQNLI